MLQYNFRLFTYCGYWVPTEWTTLGWKYTLYKLYHLLMVTLAMVYAIMRLTNFALEIISGFENIKHFGLSVFTLPHHICALFKALNLCYSRQKLIVIDKVFLTLSKAYNSKSEKKIQKDYDQTGRFVFL